MARICQFSCLVFRETLRCLAKEQKLLLSSPKGTENTRKRKRRLAISGVSQGRFDCSPRIFSNRGWLPREIDPDGYSEIVRTQRDVLEDHRCVEYFLTLIHSTPVALNPIAAFFQNSKTVTLTRKVWKTLKRLLCIFSARHYFTVYVREIVPRQGHVMKGKLPGCVHNAYYSDHIR